MSKLIGQKVECKDEPNKVGVISFYNPETGDIDITYPEGVLITHISKCKII